MGEGSNNVKVQDILRIFENNDDSEKSPTNVSNHLIQQKKTELNRESVKSPTSTSVNICTWSLRRRREGDSAEPSVGSPTKVGNKKRVSEIVQHFQGKQVPVSDVNDVCSHLKSGLSNGKFSHNNNENEVDTDGKNQGQEIEELYADNLHLDHGSKLPKGPPPQKPCRTFAHDIYLQSKLVVSKNQKVDKPRLPPKPVRSKTVSVMMSNKQSDNKKGSDLIKNRPRTPPPPRPVFISKGGAVDEKPKSSYGNLKKCLSAERIYDEPWCSSWAELQRRKTAKAKAKFQLVDNDIYIGAEEDEGEGRTKTNKKSKGDNVSGTELHYMSSPLFPMAGKHTGESKQFVFPRASISTPSRSHFRSRTEELEKEFLRRDEDVLNWSFMSIYGPKSNEPGVNSKDVDSSDSDNEISEKELQKRIDYVHKINRGNSMRLDPQEKMQTYRKQFDAVLIVGLRFEGDDTSVYKPYVKNIFPSEECLTAASPEDIAHFCFPDAHNWKPVASRETYTFVLTNEKGDRIFGYCRRVKPEGVEYNIPVVYCILSPILDRAYYFQLLGEIENRHGLPESKMKSFVQILCSRTVPQPGRSIVIRSSSLDGERQVTLKRSDEYVFDNADTFKLLERFSNSTLLKIISSFLLERRVLFSASQPELLTETIHSLVSLLYPFRWPHTFIPILPNKLIDVVASPTPFIIGILSSSTPLLEDIAIDEEGMMVNLDSGVLEREVGDETTIIPRKVQRALATALKLIRHGSGTEGFQGSEMVSKAFLRMFVELVGHYQQHVSILTDGRKIFHKDSFTTAPPSRGIQMFLKWFTETQVFDLFIDAAVNGTIYNNSVFEQKVKERQLDADALKPTLKVGVKEFSKKLKNFGEKLIGFKT